MSRQGRNFSVVVSIWMLILFFAINNGSAQQLDAAQDGPIYGDPEGLARVAAFEQELHNMSVRTDHPRVFLNKENLQEMQDRCLVYNHPSWQRVKNSADNGNMVHAAFAYLITQDEKYFNIALQKMREITQQEYKCGVDYGGHGSFSKGVYLTPAKEVIELAAAFDMVYDALSDEDRQFFINYIGRNACLDQWNYKGILLKDLPYKDRINTNEWGLNNYYIGKVGGELWHGDAWAYGAQKRIPAIVLAPHYPGAEELYKAQWDYDSKWGDGFRFLAYIADGSQGNGYSWKGLVEWALYLKNATGINILDDPRWPYFPNQGLYFLYNSDLAAKREIFHYGQGSAHIIRYIGGGSPHNSLRTDVYSGVVGKNPYHYWFVNYIKAGYETTYFGDLVFYPLVEIAIYDPTITPKDPSTASWEELPTSRLFGGLGQVIMRSDWSGDASCALIRTGPTLCINSHGGVFVANFALYRKGALSPEAGCWWNGFIERSMDGRNNIFIGEEKYGEFNATRHGTDGVIPRDPRSYGRPYGTSVPLIHNPLAWRGKISSYEASPYYTYTVVDVNEETYQTPTKKLYRSFVFIPKGTKAYFIVFDRVESVDPRPKRWRMWLVSEPEITGNKISEKVPGHIETYDGDFFKATNRWNTSAVYVKSLLPQNRRIRWIGGEGYEFGFEDEGKNYVIGEDTRADLERYFLGAPPGCDPDWREIGYGRVDISPTEVNTRDLFLNVMYLADPGDSMPPVGLKESLSGDEMCGAFIGDEDCAYLTMFAKDSAEATHFVYEINSNKIVKHLLCWLPKSEPFKIYKNGMHLLTGTTSDAGTIFFQGNPGGLGRYEVFVGQNDVNPSEENGSLPQTFCLKQNYPNPFNDSTIITYAIPPLTSNFQGLNTIRVALRVYNLTGQLVKTITDRQQKPGVYRVVWDGRDESGRKVTNGLYLYKLEIGNFVLMKKLILLR